MVAVADRSCEEAELVSWLRRRLSRRSSSRWTSPSARVAVAGAVLLVSSAGACDPAESCTGSSAGCPADAKSTTGDTCMAGVCDGEPLVCDPCDPLVGCKAAVCQPALAGKSQLTLRRKSDPAKDWLGWKWTSSGEVLLADFGTPIAGSEYNGGRGRRGCGTAPLPVLLRTYAHSLPNSPAPCP